MSDSRLDAPMVHGEVAPGFEEVASKFERNFAKRGELGVACAIYHRGRKIVELWGGYRDYDAFAPWEEETLVLAFSITNSIAALTITAAESRGLIDYDERIAADWPESPQRGKNITWRPDKVVVVLVWDEL